MIIVPHGEALTVAEAALRGAGVPREGARIQADLLVDAELGGRPSHGLLRLPRLVERIRNGVIDPNAAGVCTWMRHAFLDVDGQNGLGPVIARRAIDELARRVPSTGVAACAIRNNNHLGMLGWYARAAAERGFVLIAFSTSEALVHPWQGRQALIGTNPIAIGVPTAGQPFVLDTATSLVSMGQIHDYAQKGKALEPGWAVDAAGEPTTDAVAAKAGAIAPFGGAKGYALGLAFEVLVASLTDSALGRDVTGTLDSTEFCNKGDVFILFAPQAGGTLLARISAYLDLIRQSGGPVTGGGVAVPGDRARAARDRHRQDGLPIPADLWATLTRLAAAGSEEGNSR